MEAPRLEAPRLAQAAPFWIRLPPARWTSHGSLCVCVVWCVSLRRLSEFRVWSRTHHATFTFKHSKGIRSSDVARARRRASAPHSAVRTGVRLKYWGVWPACPCGVLQAAWARRVPFWFLSEVSPRPPEGQILHRSVPERGRGEAGAAESHLNLARPLKFLITPLPDIPSDTSFIIKMFEKLKNS